MSFLLDWCKTLLPCWLLNLLGMGHKKLLFLGLENAGKTTLLHMLKSNSLELHMPTEQPNYEGIEIGGLSFIAIDTDGYVSARQKWKHNYTAIDDVDGIVFVVDASDERRLDEARLELQRVLEDVALLRRPIPVLVLGNKIDKRSALNVDYLREQLGLTVQDKGNSNVVSELFMISIAKNQFINDAFTWFVDQIKSPTIGQNMKQ